MSSPRPAGSGTASASSRPGGAAHTNGIACTMRAAAVALPPPARSPCSSSASIVSLSDGRPMIRTPCAPPLSDRRPVGRDVVGDASEVLDDDPRPAADPALHLEAKGPLGARREGPEAVRDVACERPALHLLADLVEREPEPARDEPNLSAPHHARHARRHHRRHVVERLPEPDQVADRVRLRVELVVEDLERADLLDLLAKPAREQRHHVVDEPRIDPAHEERRAAGKTGVLHPATEILGRRRRVVEGIERRRDDAAPGAERALDVVERRVRTEVPRGA